MTKVVPPQSDPAPIEIQSPSAFEIDTSCRLPLLALFLSAAVWLVLGSIFGLIASIKFHSPEFLANYSWLTYGRVRPVYLNCVLYGFCLQSGLGVALWLLARLGGALLARRRFIAAGVKVWNLGLTIGILGILAGDNCGFDNLELPPYAAALMFLGYLFIGIPALLNFHERRQRQLFVSQWFLFAALFWFPWIYTTANLLLVVFPVRGVMQNVVDWWFSENLLGVWLGLVGVGTIFYFLPKLLERELHSHYLALLAFWMLILFTSWGGIPLAAPVPAWMPVLSKVATILTVVPLLAVLLNVYQTIWPPVEHETNGTDGTNASKGTLPAATAPRQASPRGFRAHLHSSGSLGFILFCVGAFALTGAMMISTVLLDNIQLQFTWFNTATTGLNIYGFFVMAMFGAIYYILPRVTAGAERGCPQPQPQQKGVASETLGVRSSGPARAGWGQPRSVRVHFWLATAGIVLLVLPQAIGGVMQAIQLDGASPFADVTRNMLHFLRISTIGDLLLLAGNVVFLANLIGFAARCYRARLQAAYVRATVNQFETVEVGT